MASTSNLAMRHYYLLTKAQIKMQNQFEGPLMMTEKNEIDLIVALANNCNSNLVISKESPWD